MVYLYLNDISSLCFIAGQKAAAKWRKHTNARQGAVQKALNAYNMAVQRHNTFFPSSKSLNTVKYNTDLEQITSKLKQVDGCGELSPDQMSFIRSYHTWCRLEEDRKTVVYREMRITLVHAIMDFSRAADAVETHQRSFAWVRELVWRWRTSSLEYLCTCMRLFWNHLKPKSKRVGVDVDRVPDPDLHGKELHHPHLAPGTRRISDVMAALRDSDANMVSSDEDYETDEEDHADIGIEDEDGKDVDDEDDGVSTDDEEDENALTTSASTSGSTAGRLNAAPLTLASTTGTLPFVGRSTVVGIVSGDIPAATDGIRTAVRQEVHADDDASAGRGVDETGTELGVDPSAQQ